MKKILVVLISIFIIIMSLTSCKKSDKTIILITDEAGINDGYYNQLTYDGLKKAASEFDFNLVVSTPKNSSQYDVVFQDVVDQNPNLIVISNPDMEATAVAYAKNNPDLDFVLVESSADLNLDGVQDATNIYSIRFQQSQEGFISGVLAAALAVNHVAFIGANEFNSYIQYESGFRAGVTTINPSVSVDVIYIKESTASDQVQAQVAQMIQNGVQVIFTINKNTGIYTAAQEAGIPVIICDYDYSGQITTGKKSIAFTTEKKIDQAVFIAVSDYFNGLFKGQIKYFTFADDCFGYKIIEKSVVTDDAETLIIAWAAELKNRTFTVPDTRAQYNTFAPPQLTVQDQAE